MNKYIGIYKTYCSAAHGYISMNEGTKKLFSVSILSGVGLIIFKICIRIPGSFQVSNWVYRYSWKVIHKRTGWSDFNSSNRPTFSHLRFHIMRLRHFVLKEPRFSTHSSLPSLLSQLWNTIYLAPHMHMNEILVLMSTKKQDLIVFILLIRRYNDRTGEKLRVLCFLCFHYPNFDLHILYHWYWVLSIYEY